MIPEGEVIITSEISNRIVVSIIGGGAAGLAVDIALFPLDTIKTRLQSQYGFFNSGGFHGVYKGIGPMAVGSPVSGAIFFGTYETVKHLLLSKELENLAPIMHMCSASIGEVVCCVVKVPMEIMKQRRQAGFRNLSAIKILKLAVQEEGIRGLYRGYGSTILRDIPFSIIEFPIWEWLKKKCKTTFERDLTAAEAAVCGSIAGGVAAAITTPLDVIKTQIMLEKTVPKTFVEPSIFAIGRKIYLQYGITKLFAGFIPRISMIMLGGGIFFGIYEKTCSLVDNKTV